ncbi:hypothetical protein AOQ84DRAFT_424857 [Glonium stellatum]|uniref:Uncharacterized protein n=1 Tax=Glonium stellatum TaxID=574774 RepID=A0A8E2F748_9PEZI|nr:hypothetical protein AOQ84DRAFT_424857 [Glonium stellatum]
MDDLINKVRNIEITSHGSRRQLQTLDKDAQASIGEEVNSMRDVLTNGDGKIHYVFSQTQYFLNGIKDSDIDPSLTDLKPQMTWLGKNLGEIVDELKKGQSRAETAMNYAAEYAYKVNDVKQEVEISRGKLMEAHRDNELLTSEAQSELSINEELLRETQSKIAIKEGEIRTRTNEADAKRKQRQDLDSEISNKNREISEAERRQRRKEDKATAGAGLGMFGLFLAPFTLGVSLGVTAAGAGVLISSSADISNLRDQINAANASIGRLQTEIAEADRDVLTLERQKRELQQLIKKYQSEVDTCKMKHQEHQCQIQKTSEIQSEILLLLDYASSTKLTAEEIQRELQKVKQKLDTCSALLGERYEDVQASSGSVEGLLKRQHQRKRDFSGQRDLMQDVLNTLDKIHSDVPVLLESHDAKFLDAKPWNGDSRSVVDVGSPIPELCCRT